MSKYSQGICQDGAAILKDGQMMTIEEILEDLNNQEKLVEALREAADMLKIAGEWKAEQSARALIAELEVEKGENG